MPLAEAIISSRNQISAYDSGSVTINEIKYHQSLLLTTDKIISPWPVSVLEQLDAQTFAPIIALEPEVVLLGTGDRQCFPERRCFSYFGERRIGLEVMDNGALCRTFNILIAEGRAVVAAIILG